MSRDQFEKYTKVSFDIQILLAKVTFIEPVINLYFISVAVRNYP